MANLQFTLESSNIVCHNHGKVTGGSSTSYKNLQDSLSHNSIPYKVISTR